MQIVSLSYDMVTTSFIVRLQYPQLRKVHSVCQIWTPTKNELTCLYSVKYFQLSFSKVGCCATVIPKTVKYKQKQIMKIKGYSTGFQVCPNKACIYQITFTQPFFFNCKIGQPDTKEENVHILKTFRRTWPTKEANTQPTKEALCKGANVCSSMHCLPHNDITGEKY